LQHGGAFMFAFAVCGRTNKDGDMAVH